MRIGELLTKSGLVDDRAISDALDFQTRCTVSMPIGKVLTQLHFLSEEDLQLVLQAQRKINFSNMSENLAIASIKWAKEKNVAFDVASQAVLASVQTGAKIIDTKQTMVRLKPLALLREEQERQSRETAAAQAASEQAASEQAQPIAFARTSGGPSFGESPESLMRDGDNAVDIEHWVLAESLYLRARVVVDRSDGYEERELIPILRKLATSQRALKKWADAEKNLLRLIEIIRKQHGDQHPDLRNLLADLAEVYTGLNCPDKADPLYQKVLGLFDDLLQRDSNRYLEMLRNGVSSALKRTVVRSSKKLGDMLTEAKLITDEQRLSALQSAKRSRKPLGRALIDMNMLSQNGLKSALRLQLASRTGALPSAYVPRILRACTILGLSPEEVTGMAELLPASGANDNSEITQMIVLMDRLLSIESTFGAEHPDVGDLSAKIADMCLRRGELVEAECAYQRAHTVYTRAGDDYKLRLANVSFKLAKLYKQNDRLADVEPLLMETMQIKQKLLGSDHNDVVAAIVELGNLHAAQLNYHGAVGFYRAALSVTETKRGSSHPELRFILEPLARCFEEVGMLDDADAATQRLKAIQSLLAQTAV